MSWKGMTCNSRFIHKIVEAHFSVNSVRRWIYALNFINFYWSFVSSGTLLLFCNSFFVAVFFPVQKVWSIRNHLIFLLFIPQWCEIISQWATFTSILCFLNSSIKVWMFYKHLRGKSLKIKNTLSNMISTPL